MFNPKKRRGLLAAEITKASSRQTYYTIRFFADQNLREDAYRAYAYFRWVDDVLDAPGGDPNVKKRFLKRQQKLLVAALEGGKTGEITPEENMLVQMIHNDTGEKHGLHSYLHNMMKVMQFDTERRGRAISYAELEEYTNHLAIAVQDALFYFIGHEDPIPPEYGRYHAVTAAHITHMLRDMYEDTGVGYYNIPLDYLRLHDLRPDDFGKPAFQQWVHRRVEQAKKYFKLGREYISQVKNFRCRLAGLAYTARFEWVLDAIQQDGYQLRPEYSQRRRIKAAFQICWRTLISLLTSLIKSRKIKPVPHPSTGLND